MKKALLLVSVLFISVISTACINKFAVQELNNKAKAYIEQGDYQNAIERLKSSADLDNTYFETFYSLAVAYTQAEQYSEAIEAYKKAIELNPDYADSYYSLAVAEEDFAVDLAKGVIKVNDEGEVVKVDEEEQAKLSKLTLNSQSQELIENLLAEAVKNYTIYLQKSTNLEDSEDVKNKIDELNEEQQSYANTNNKG